MGGGDIWESAEGSTILHITSGELTTSKPVNCQSDIDGAED